MKYSIHYTFFYFYDFSIAVYISPSPRGLQVNPSASRWYPSLHKHWWPWSSFSHFCWQIPHVSHIFVAKKKMKEMIIYLIIIIILDKWILKYPYADKFCCPCSDLYSHCTDRCKGSWPVKEEQGDRCQNRCGFYKQQ